MALVTLDVTGQILHPDLTPASGTVTFQIPIDLNDVVDNVTYTPASFTQTLDVAGNFTFTGLIATDSPDLAESGAWMYRVHVLTDAYAQSFSTSLPAALAPVADFTDLIPAQSEPCTDDGTPCASVAQFADLQNQIDDLVVENFVESVNGYPGPHINLVAADIGLGNVNNTSDLAKPISTATQAALDLKADDSDVVHITGDTMTGDLVINAGLHVNTTVATDIGSPIVDVLFTTFPVAADPNLFEVAINNDPTELVTWWNESGRYRAEQRAAIGFDHLITLVASNAVAAGRLLQFERRDGANVRQTMGGVNQDGRLMTTLYPFTAITNIDPGATGKYTAQVAALVELPGVRRNFDDEVRIRGRIAVTAAGPVAGDVIMVIPAGFTPANQQWLSVTTTTGIAVPCEIMTSGNVVCRRTQAGATNLCFENFVYKTS
jgi:hypothetical protein